MDEQRTELERLAEAALNAQTLGEFSDILGRLGQQAQAPAPPRDDLAQRVVAQVDPERMPAFADGVAVGMWLARRPDLLALRARGPWLDAQGRAALEGHEAQERLALEACARRGIRTE